MTGMLAALRCILGGRWAEIAEAGKAQIFLVRAELMRRSRPIGELVRVTSCDNSFVTALSPPQKQSCQSAASAIDRAARYGIFSPSCLTRALALSRMLDEKGVVGHAVRVGVHRDGNAFIAHAWVERGELILGDAIPDPRLFSVLAQVSAM